MKTTKRQLRQIIKKEKLKLLREQAGRVPPPESYDHGDVVLKQAMDLFGSGALVDEQDGEVVVDTGVVDTDIEEMYDQWIEVWPDGMHEEGGLIYTGVMVEGALQEQYGREPFTPEEEAVIAAMESLENAIIAMGKSNPELTDYYISLFRTLQDAGVNVDAVAMSA